MSDGLEEVKRDLAMNASHVEDIGPGGCLSVMDALALREWFDRRQAVLRCLCWKDVCFDDACPTCALLDSDARCPGQDR